MRLALLTEVKEKQYLQNTTYRHNINNEKILYKKLSLIVTNYNL